MNGIGSSSKGGEVVALQPDTQIILREHRGSHGAHLRELSVAAIEACLKVVANGDLAVSSDPWD